MGRRCIFFFIVCAVALIMPVNMASADLTDWSLGLVTMITDPVGDNIGGNAWQDITAIYYKLDPGNALYFKMDLNAPVEGANVQQYQIGIDATPQVITAAETHPGYISPALTALGVDHLLDSRYFGGFSDANNRWIVDNPPVADNQLSSVGGQFEYEVTGGGFGELEWSVPLSELGYIQSFTVYGAVNLFGSTYDVTGPLEGSSVPEPGTLALLGILSGVGYAFRRKKTGQTTTPAIG